MAPWVDGTKSADAYDEIFPMWLKKFAEGDGFESGIRYKGKLVGMVGIHPVSWKKSDESWVLSCRDYGGKGIMTRSVKAVLHYAFENLKLNKIEIRCGVGNAKSRAIPERLGFKLDGILRDEEWLYDHFHDIAVYSLLASEWKEIR